MIRMRGPVAAHPASVIRPLLLPDSPVVIWWPGQCPGQPGQRRAGPAGRPAADRRRCRRRGRWRRCWTRAESYQPGDTDLAWTRLTRWRATAGRCPGPVPGPDQGRRRSRRSAGIRRPTAGGLAADAAEGADVAQDQRRTGHHRRPDDHSRRRHRHHPARRPAGLLRRARAAGAPGGPEAAGDHRPDQRGTAPDGRRRGLRGRRQGAAEVRSDERAGQEAPTAGEEGAATRDEATRQTRRR